MYVFWWVYRVLLMTKYTKRREYVKRDVYMYEKRPIDIYIYEQRPIYAYGRNVWKKRMYICLCIRVWWVYTIGLFSYVCIRLFSHVHISFYIFSSTPHDYVNMPVCWGIVGLSCVVDDKIYKET